MTSGRDRILQSGAELFAANGFAATTTRDIAERAGIRQPSLYAHFKTKSDILRELLIETLRPAVERGEQLAAGPGPARDRLVTMLDFDIRTLFASRRPVAVLGVLPEVRGDDFREAHELRERLRDAYTTLARDVLTELGHPPGEEYLRRIAGIVFAVVESINLRRYEDPGLTSDDAIRDTTTAILRILGA
jgi:AcrR family transcriptional regulator